MENSDGLPASWSGGLRNTTFMIKDPVFLYVEDDPYSIKVMRMIFEKVMRIPTLIVFEGSDNFMQNLLELNTPPDVFLLDIQMKPYNGFELLHMIRADRRFRASKIVALTASVMGEEVDQLKRSGFDGAISKPIHITSFPGLINRVLNGENIWFVS